MSAAGGALVLFTRDLRVHDQRALSSAVRECERVVPAFVLDEALLARSRRPSNRLAFLLDSLRDLDASLRRRGARLIIREGDVVEEAMKLVHEHRLATIHVSADVTPYASARRERLLRECTSARVQLREHDGVTVVPAGALTPAGGDHYRVFTPYWRVWSTASHAAPLPAPVHVPLPARVRAGRVPRLDHLTDASCSPRLRAGGETAARKRLASWIRGGGSRYEDIHDDLASDATSQLGAYLHFGCLSPSTLLARAQHSPQGQALARQLCWRDFHHQVLAARPDLPHADYRPRGDRWRRDDDELRAWRDGLTGYPIVDAGMRQLAVEGFMHNRARLIVASFLTKTLYLDWRAGAAHFARLLLDADVANNVGNWQWVAGTGNDTRPNRVLNPIRQARRFDPRGDYVRRHVPELASVSGAAVHEPWRLSGGRTLDYPPPLIEPGTARRARRQGSS